MGTAPQMLGGLNPTAVHNAFVTMVNTHGVYSQVVAANLTDQEWQLLAWRYPGDLRTMLPARNLAIRQKYALARSKGAPFVPPTLGAAGSLDATVTEIYLDFRLYGGPLYSPLSAEAASLCTSVYVGGLLYVSAWAGYQAGSVMATWIQANDQVSWNHIVTAVGTFVYWMNELQQAAATSASVTAAGLEWNMSNYIFSVSPAEVSNGGDWGGWGVLDDAAIEFATDGGGFCVNPGFC